MTDELKKLYNVIISRKQYKEEGSYTCYLFEQGINKILKKIGEESSELIIAAKDGDKQRITEETGDLLYHIMVLLVERGVSLEEIKQELTKRSKVTGNLKQMKTVDKNS